MDGRGNVGLLVVRRDRKRSRFFRFPFFPGAFDRGEPILITYVTRPAFPVFILDIDGRGRQLPDVKPQSVTHSTRCRAPKGRPSLAQANGP